MSDYNFLMEIRLAPSQFQVLNHISRVSAALGINLYLVGGAVRDLTSGQGNIRDLDFVAEGNTQRILKALISESSRRPAKSSPLQSQPSIELEHSHYDARSQTASLYFGNGVEAEIETAHKESYSKPGRPPEIIPAGIFEDLRRRDFSVNAMAVSLHPNSRGLLLDPTNGALDIENREFRALHSRSFLEDPSRIYRLLRLTLRLGFKIEERTQSWLESALQNKAWEAMTPQQQGRELRAALQEQNPAKVFRIYDERDLLPGLDRSLSAARIPYDRLEKIRSIIRSVEGANPFLLYFDCLVEKLSAAHKKRLAQKVMPDSKTLQMALSLEPEARKLAKLLGGPKANAASYVYELLKDKPQPLLLYVLTHFPQGKIQARLKSFLFKYPQMRAKLPRAELQALGIEPGPRFEKIMEELFRAMLDGKIKTHAQAVKALHNLAGIKPPEAGRIEAAAPAKPQVPTKRAASRGRKTRKSRR
jgi:tRNA nucleotidyltransferase/poly(A) polymerase